MKCGYVSRYLVTVFVTVSDCCPLPPCVVQWTMNAECVNLEGLQSWHLADGVNPVYVDGRTNACLLCASQWASWVCHGTGAHRMSAVVCWPAVGREYDGIFPVWDWSRLPGTTEWTGGVPCTPCSSPLRGTTKLVGGSSTGMYGAAAMQLHTGEALLGRGRCVNRSQGRR